MPDGQTSGFDINAARQAGYSDDEMLQHLTSTRNFNVDAAAKAGYSKAEIINYLSTTPPQNIPGAPNGLPGVPAPENPITGKTVERHRMVPGPGGGLPQDYKMTQDEADKAQNLTTTGLGLAATGAGLVAAPAATVGAIIGSTAGGKGAKYIAKKAGAGETGQDIAEFRGGLVGNLAGGAGGVKTGDLPSTEQAGNLFNEVSAATKDKPIELTDEVYDALKNIKQLADAGAKGTPRVASKLANRLNNVDEELYWDEARRFYSNISRLSANEYNSMNPQMQRAVGQLGRAIGDVLQGTAESAGKGDEYAQAMQLYSKAKAWQNFGANTWQFVKRAAPIAVGMGAGGRMALSHLLDYIP